MNTEPEALRLADEFEKAWIDVEPCVAAAAELRRLHEENESLKKRLFEMQNAAIDLANQNQELVEALK